MYLHLGQSVVVPFRDVYKRQVMLLAGEDSIREIIPFPMNKNAQDLMMDAPSTVSQKQLDELHIALVEPEA